MPDHDDLQFRCYEACCASCDCFAPVNDLGLCENCTGQLERDLIRKRDWDHSVSAFGLNDAQREQLYRQVIRQFGAAFELIAPLEKQGAKGKRKKRKVHRQYQRS